MERATVKSQIIIDLKEKLQQGEYDALQEFWNMIENQGTPLIEEIVEDTKNTLVTFIYKGDQETENVILISPIGLDQLEQIKLERLLGSNVWYQTYKVKNNLRFCYDFSVNDPLNGDWKKRSQKFQYDKLCKNKLVFKNNNEGKDSFASYAIMPNVETDIWIKENADIQKGTIQEIGFKSKLLGNERKVRIYKPAGYDEYSEPFRIVVLTDDDEYINLLSATTVLDNLISKQLIPPVVTVFVDSTKRRYEELTCNDKFIDMIVLELLPIVRSKYNITNKPDKSIIGGLSIGGLTASYIGLNHSEVFGNVLSQSGSYWYKPEGYHKSNWLSSLFDEIDRLPLKFYLNVGVLENKIKMIDTNKYFRDVLGKKGYHVHYEEFNSGHDFLSWGETLGNGLISLIGNEMNPRI